MALVNLCKECVFFRVMEGNQVISEYHHVMEGIRYNTPEAHLTGPKKGKCLRYPATEVKYENDICGEFKKVK